MLFSSYSLAAPPPNANPNSDISKWYKSLERPDLPGIGCCDTSDCRPVPARLNTNGIWEVFLEKENIWIIVPEVKIIKDKNHPSGSAVLCHIGDHIFCFVKPAIGG
jgi:hypothetical protein